MTLCVCSASEASPLCTCFDTLEHLQGIACAAAGLSAEPIKVFLKRFAYLINSVLCKKKSFIFNSKFLLHWIS
jgi:hypothetical protein